MSTYLKKNVKSLVGQIVYKAFQPHKVGKIIRDGGQKGNLLRDITIRWVDGTEQTWKEEGGSTLNDFAALVEVTERKAKKHRALLEKAKRL